MYTFSQSHMIVLGRLPAPIGISVTMPFISPEIVYIAVELPSRLKSDGAIAKPALTTLAAQYFPKSWIYRKNQGFPTQSTRWPKGQLGRWSGILSEERTTFRGVLDLAALRAAEVGRDDEAI